MSVHSKIFPMHSTVQRATKLSLNFGVSTGRLDSRANFDVISDFPDFLDFASYPYGILKVILNLKTQKFLLFFTIVSFLVHCRGLKVPKYL